MLIVEGVYHWRPRRVAFRNDYCVRCGAERVAIQVRTIDVWHVYWIPLVPLGVLAALAAIMWFAPTRANEPDMIVIWAMRLLFSALLVAALF